MLYNSTLLKQLPHKKEAVKRRKTTKIIEDTFLVNVYKLTKRYRFHSSPKRIVCAFLTAIHSMKQKKTKD